jgi:hypothetical protein
MQYGRCPHTQTRQHCTGEGQHLQWRQRRHTTAWGLVSLIASSREWKEGRTALQVQGLTKQQM